MTTTSEVGISPALLQAITQTLSTNRPSHSDSRDIRDNAPRAEHIVISGEKPLIKVEGDGQPHLLQGMNEPVTNLAQLGSGETVIVVQNVDGTESGEHQSPQGIAQHVIIKNMPSGAIQNVVVSASTDKEQREDGSRDLNTCNMGNVLSAIATQLRGDHGQNLSTSGDESSQDLVEGSSTQQHPIYISVAANSAVPSPEHDVTVAEFAENIVTETIVQTSHDLDSPTSKQLRVLEPNMQQLHSQNGASLILNAGPVPERAVLEAVKGDGGETHYVYRTLKLDTPDIPPLPYDPSEACPICGDKISGYHYGIYTCESCKGFFKRTVQNKKSFICHRKGDCVITVQNRKKCPACRFKRCILGGMKLEAIREDRTRGGRSSYDGCSPHGRPNKPPRREPTPKNVVYARVPAAVNSDNVPSAQATNIVKPTKQQSGKDVVPHTPQILEDLMAVESLLSEEEEEQECCEGKFTEGDPNLFSSLLHLADHCLYKIVRWARNLPDFPSVSTDDQILLLQNCWAELLCLTSCWKSIPAEGEIRLCHGRMLDLGKAEVMGLAEVTQRLIDITTNLRRLAVDHHEIVALKVLLLLSPDVKNLKDKEVIRQYQDRLLDALRIYTMTHSPNKPSKFIELLAKLPEFSRTCIIAKEQLTQRQAAGDVPQYSLLSELLKGDIAVQ